MHLTGMLKRLLAMQEAQVLAVAWKLAALAAAKGFADVAGAALELTPDVAAEFREWLGAR